MENLLYSERIDLRKGESYWLGTFVSWPFAKIEVFQDMIVLSAPMSKTVFKKEEIKWIEEYGYPLPGIFFKGLKIVHTKKGEKPYVALFSKDRPRLIKELKKAGYTLKVEE